MHFINSKGAFYKIAFKDAITQIPGEYTLEWDNSAYIEDVRDRKPTLKPIWPFNDSDMYLYEVEYASGILRSNGRQKQLILSLLGLQLQAILWLDVGWWLQLRFDP